MSALRMVRLDRVRRHGDALAVDANNGVAVITTTLEDDALASVLAHLAEAIATGDYYLDQRA